ncbi:MAG: nuclear transport factor 2 family protein [Balneola sp.]
MKQLFRIICSIIVIGCSYQSTYSQYYGELFDQISHMDSLYFTAQNNCDLKEYSSYLSEDFEFFHDKSGYTASKDDEMKSMAMFCGDEQRTRQPIRRELIEESMIVYPMNNFGALELAEHVFYLQIPDGNEKLIGSGKLSALWKLINNQWKLTRVISYDHQPLAEVELSQEVLDQYVGDFALPDRIVNIKREGKLLRVSDIVEGETVWTKELFPETENKFYLNYQNVVFEFLKEGTTASTLNIYDNGKLVEKAQRVN